MYSGRSDWETPAPPTTTLWRVFQRYRAVATAAGLSVRTVEQNISEMKKIVGREENPKTIILSDLNDKYIRDFFDREMQTIDVSDEHLRQRKLRSIRSTLSQARSIFKEDWIKRYSDHDMEIPDLKQFLKEKVERPKESRHQQVEDGVFENIEKKLETIVDSDPAIYIIYLLAKATLRRGEIQSAKWDWIVQLKGQPHFRMDENQKGKRRTDIPICQNIYKKLCEWRIKHDGEFIVPENGWATERCGYSCKEFDSWIRKAGLKTPHTLHEVRARSIYLVREKYGLEVATSFGRHTDSEVTETHYAGEKKLPSNFSFG